MIKFFRHIRKSLINQNEMGKYFKYAIGEILLVVIGILIALQVSNWNEDRKMDSKETAVLGLIHEEFSENKIQLDTVVSFHKSAKKSCEKLISMFPIDSKKSNLDSIGKHLYNVMFHYTFNPSRGSINGIINTSSLEIISNDELRQILVTWNDLLLDYQEDEEVGKAIVQRQLDPIFSKYFEFDFSFEDNRNKVEFLESLEFEYLIKLRLISLEDILSGSEFDRLKNSLDKIIELSTP